MMMKQKLYSLIFLCSLWGGGVCSVHGQTTMTLRFQDGTEKNTAISTVNKMILSETNLALDYLSGNSDSYTLGLIQKITFSTLSGTNNILADNLVMSVYPNPATDYILLKNAPEGQLNAEVYRMDGAEVINVQLTSSSDKIDVSGLAKGFYILKVNNKALKFTKQ